MDADKHFELAVAIARDALKASLIVNGGAATALVALMDKTPNGNDFTIPVLLFGAGAVASVISMYCGYFSQLNFANSVVQSGHPITIPHSYKSGKRHERWQYITFLFVAGSLVFMTLGIWSAAHIAGTTKSSAQIPPSAISKPLTAPLPLAGQHH